MTRISWNRSEFWFLFATCVFLQFVLNAIITISFHDEEKEKNVMLEDENKPENNSYENEKKFDIAQGIFGKDNVRSMNAKHLLPDDQTIEKLYGSSSKIIGLNTCDRYKREVTFENRIIAPAGLFNSGTHLLFELLSRNCLFDSTQQVQDAVAWGKHIPASWRDSWTKSITPSIGLGRHQKFKGNKPAHGVRDERSYSKTDKYPFVEKKRVLPIVITKDPYTWMKSMCRHPYRLVWLHDPDHCPNLVPNEIDFKHNWKDTSPAMVMHRLDSNFTYHSSLVGVWNDWYNDYYNDFHHPHLIIRYEDLLFRPHSVIKDVCDCAGGKILSFNLIHQNAKGQMGEHKGSTNGLLDAFIKYGNEEKRIKDYTSEDLKYAKKHLNQDLMKVFGYHHPPNKGNK